MKKVDKSTRSLLTPFMAGLRRPQRPKMVKIKSIDSRIATLDNGLKVALPKGTSYSKGDYITVVGGSVK